MEQRHWFKTVRETEGGNGHCGAHHLQSGDKSFTVTIRKSEEAKLGCKGRWARCIQGKTNEHISPEMWKYQCWTQDYLVGNRKPTLKNSKTFILLPLNILQIKSWAEIIILFVYRLRCQENKPYIPNNQANKVTESDSDNWTKSNRIPSISAQ